MAKEKDLICNICQLVIDKNKEYARLTHFNKKDSVKSEAHYHIQCFRDRMNGGAQLKDLQEQAKRILNMAEVKLA